MMLPEARFTDRVIFYEMGRPDYPRTVLDLLRRKSGLEHHHVIADIGCGTGISSQLFLENGNSVFGVDPNNAMLRSCESLKPRYDKFRPVIGKSDATNLPDESVDMIVAAQAFHWFDPIPTKLEFDRILKPGGSVSLIWNERKTKGSEFLEAYEDFVLRHNTDYLKVDHRQITDQKIEDFFGTNDYWKESLDHHQRLDINGFVARVRSTSYMPSEGQIGFDKMIEEIPPLFEMFEENGLITLEYSTNVYGIEKSKIR